MLPRIMSAADRMSRVVCVCSHLCRGPLRSLVCCWRRWCTLWRKQTHPLTIPRRRSESGGDDRACKVARSVLALSSVSVLVPSTCGQTSSVDRGLASDTIASDKCKEVVLLLLAKPASNLTNTFALPVPEQDNQIGLLCKQHIPCCRSSWDFEQLLA